MYLTNKSETSMDALHCHSECMDSTYQRIPEPTARVRAPEAPSAGIQCWQQESGKGPTTSPSRHTGIKHFAVSQFVGAVGESGAAHGLGPSIALCSSTITWSGVASQVGQHCPSIRVSLNGGRHSTSAQPGRS